MRLGRILVKGGEARLVFVHEGACVDLAAAAEMAEKDGGRQVSGLDLIVGREGRMGPLIEAGDDALDACRRLVEDFAACVQKGGGDAGPYHAAVCREPDFSWLPPVEDPPFVFGLTGNSPKWWRPKPFNLPKYPIGFMRPFSSACGHRVPIQSRFRAVRGAAELGVVTRRVPGRIGEKEAGAYVFGYTCVNDLTTDIWRDFALHRHGEDGGLLTYFERNTTAIYARSYDQSFPVGPYIVTRDEVQDPYDLLFFVRLDGELVDRSHTNAMINGVENTLSYWSRFFPVGAGSLFYMGTMGVDGVRVQADMVKEGREEILVSIAMDEAMELQNPVVFRPPFEELP